MGEWEILLLQFSSFFGISAKSQSKGNFLKNVSRAALFQCCCRVFEQIATIVSQEIKIHSSNERNAKSILVIVVACGVLADLVGL